MVLKRTRSESDILIIDASKNYEKAGKNNKLRARDIKEIVDTLHCRKDVPKYAKLVTKEEVRENGYDLNIPKYVDSSEEEEKWDIHSLMFGGIPKTEVSQLRKYFDTFPDLYDRLFKEISQDYVAIEEMHINRAVCGLLSVEDYFDLYKQNFDGIEELLKDHLIENILDVNAQSTKEEVCSEIFKRIDSVPLMDKYVAYQILSENWEDVITDLEMIQGEGFDSIFKIDPNIVRKKKNDDDEEVPEVQEGWNGHILPFELVQEELHSDELHEINVIEERLGEIVSLYGEVLDSLDEDELEQSITNEEKNAFVAKEVKKYVAEVLNDVESEEINALKEYLTLSKKKDKIAYIENTDTVDWSQIVANKDGTFGKANINARILQLQMEFDFPEGSLEAKMKQVALLLDEESELKKNLREKRNLLDSMTKETIENLEEDTALRLLEKKWIQPIVSGLNQMPKTVVDQMILKLEELKEKYAITYKDIEASKRETTSSLIDMINDLTGSPYDLEGLEEFKRFMEE